MQQIPKNFVNYIIAIIAGIALFRVISLGLYPLFDPTEGRYAEIGRKMLENGNWVTPFIEYNVPFWAKPPLSFWLTAISYKIFGINAFAARLPSFFMMAGIVYLLWGVAKKLHNANYAWLTVTILSSMGLFFYLAGAVMTDPTLAFGITLTMVAFWRAVMWQEKLWHYPFFVGIAIAMLAKGPIGVVLMGLPILTWAIWNGKLRDVWKNLPWIYGSLLILAIILPWYIMAEIRTPGFLRYFIIGEHFERFLNKGWKGDLYGSGRAHFKGTIWLFAILAMLPWSILLLAAPFFKSAREIFAATAAADKIWHRYLLLWALAPLLFFTMAGNILITYVISSLPAFALLLAPWVTNILQKKGGVLFVKIMLLFSPAVFCIVLVLINLNPAARWIKSEEEIIKVYKALTKNEIIPVIYVGKHSYSEDFYLGHGDIELRDINDVRPYLTTEIFIIMPVAFYSKIPQDLQKKLAIVAQKNDSVLLHNIP